MAVNNLLQIRHTLQQKLELKNAIKRHMTMLRHEFTEKAQAWLVVPVH